MWNFFLYSYIVKPSYGQRKYVMLYLRKIVKTLNILLPLVAFCFKIMWRN